jgi:hypothetical protein
VEGPRSKIVNQIYINAHSTPFQLLSDDCMFVNQDVFIVINIKFLEVYFT